MVSTMTLEELSDDILNNLLKYEMVKYPIYVPSRKRPDVFLTTKALQDDGLFFYVVIEPQDEKDYLKYYPRHNLLIMPENDMGISYVRNFCKQHSKSLAKFHWQIDDNISKFMIRDIKNKKNRKHGAKNLLAAAEYVNDLFENIGISSLCHTVFAWSKKYNIDVNKQVYSCVLVNNLLDIDWRDGLIEDTDYSLQVLSKNYCTLLFNRLLIDKAVTMKLKGGNTEISHGGDGRLKRSLALQKQWPGVFKLTEHFENEQRNVKIAPSQVWKRFSQQPIEKNTNSNNLLTFLSE
jgi:hypothetical protein